jgi:hypothetical protein
MQELRQNYLLENVNLIFRDWLGEPMVSLNTILPLIASINSIKICDRDLYENTDSKLGKPILKSARVIETW